LKRDFASTIAEPGVLLVGYFNFLLLDFAAGLPGISGSAEVRP
jgi:hypothetical protein